MHRVAFFETGRLKIAYLFPLIFGLTFIVVYFGVWERLLYRLGLKIDPKSQFGDSDFKEKFSQFSSEVIRDSDRLAEFFASPSTSPPVPADTPDLHLDLENAQV